MTRIQANSGIKRRRFSISGILFSVAMLVSAIGAAAGQCLLNEDLVMEFFRSRPLLPLDAALWSIFPGVSLLIASGFVFALATRRLFWSTRARKEGGNPANASTPDLAPGLEASAGRNHFVWWLVCQFAAVLVGLGLAGYLASILLAGKYSP
ncbi:MAG: hypothetical protein Q7O66_16465, partial [Dehalococcoidia bacterium]|nr:hypothetical protein [Dehalococcoidia bacterium]